MFVACSSHIGAKYSESQLSKEAFPKDIKLASLEDLWTLFRDFEISPSFCSKHRLTALFRSLLVAPPPPSAAGHHFLNPPPSPLPHPSQVELGSLLPIPSAPSPVRIVARKQPSSPLKPGGLIPPPLSSVLGATGGAKTDSMLSFNGFLQLLWSVVGDAGDDAARSTPAQRITKLLLRMDRFLLSSLRSRMSL